MRATNGIHLGVHCSYRCHHKLCRNTKGAQVIEQHQYMEFRFVNILFDGAPPSDWEVTAWQAQYEWVEEDSFFTCSNATLQAVWDLNEYTVKMGLLDTFTDSNTRERKPYEAWCAFFGRNLHSGMPLVSTPARLHRSGA